VGSGVIIRADGAILTNEHVIDGADPEDIFCTLSNGDEYTVKAVISDHRSDLAVLRIDAKDLPEARMGDLKSVRQGHFAVVMGNPFGLAAEGKPAMSFGIISQLGRPLTSQLSPNLDRYYGNLIETDARINLGNSGGPLLNIRGEVIGITTAVSTRSGGNEGVGYAIPMDERTKSIVAQLLRGEEVEYGFLGIDLEPPTAEDRRSAGAPPGIGALVRRVEEHTPAANSELRSGDLIVEFDGQPVHDMDQLILMAEAARIGTPVSVTIFRNGARQTISVAPARRPVIPGVNYQPPMTWRGLTLADITPELRDRYAIEPETAGVVITAIDEEVLNRVGAALRDEIQEGVVVSQVNGEEIASLYQFKKATARADGPVKVSLVARDLAIDVTLPPQFPN
jgi:serine protease Do